MPLSVLLILGLVGIWLIARGNAGMRAAELRRATEDPDGATLDELARAGSDLTRQHLVEFYLYLPREELAEGMAATLRTEGFDTRVSRNDKEGDWILLASRLMVPELAPLRALRERLTALVGAQGGNYDGWGTEVENDDAQQ